MIFHSLMTQEPRIKLEVNNLVLNQVNERMFLGTVMEITRIYIKHKKCVR